MNHQWYIARMPITEEGAQRIHKMLTTYSAGGRARPLYSVGDVTETQLKHLKEYFGRMGRKFKFQTIDILAHDLIHIYNAKMERDGMAAEQVINIPTKAFDTNAVIAPSEANRRDRAVLVNNGFYVVLKFNDRGTVSVVSVIDKN